MFTPKLMNNSGLLVATGHIYPLSSNCCFRSMSGHRVPHNAAAHFYSTTKYAVTALTEGLRQELHEANTQIRATVTSIGRSVD